MVGYSRGWLRAGVLAGAFGLIGLAGGCSTEGGVSGFVGEFSRVDVRVDTDVAGTANSSGVRACAEGNTLYVVYLDARNGENDVYFNRSTDGGSTFMPSDIRIDTGNTPGSARASDVAICCDAGVVHVAWEDRRNGLSDIYYNRSTDGGLTWLPAAVRLDVDAPGAGSSGDPIIKCAGSRVYVVWEDERSLVGGTRDLVFRYSVDAGATFVAGDTVLNTNGEGTSLSDRPRMAVNGNNIVICWHDNRNGELDVYVNVSKDGGATWLPADVRIESDTPGASLSLDPEICIEDHRVYVAWGDGRDGETDIRFNRSLDGGSTWMAQDVRIDTDAPGSALSRRARISCYGDYVFVAWVDDRDGALDVRIRRSLDSGTTWLDNDMRVDTDPAGAGNSEFPRVVVSGINAWVVWQDNRDGNNDIRLNYTNDCGGNWLSQDLKCDAHPEGVSNSVFPRMVVQGEKVYLVWSDQRDGAGDIYVNSSR